MIFKRHFKYYLPRVSTSLRYKFTRPSIGYQQDLFSNKKVSVFSPFMAITLGGLLVNSSSSM